MKATTVKRIMEEFTYQCHANDEAVHLTIDGNGFTSFVIALEDSWSVDIEEGVLILENRKTVEYIDTESITRITI